MQKDIRKINDYVKEKKIHEIEVLNLPIWPLIRTEVSDRILKKQGFFESRNNTSISLKKIIQGSSGALVSAFHLIKLVCTKQKKKEMFVGFARRSLDEGVWVDKFHDPILKNKTSDDYLFLEKPYKFEHFKNDLARYKVIYYDLEVYLSEILSRILYPFYIGKVRKQIKETDLMKLLNDHEYLSSLITRKLIKFKIGKFISDLIFKNVEIDNLYLTNRSIHYPMILSAKENNVNVYELQHGVVLQEDALYNDIDEGKLSVDYFLTFSPYWSENYCWAGYSTKVIPFGFKYIHDKRAKFRRENSKRNDVLVISQPEMAKMLCLDIIKLSNSYSDINFIIKLHPQDIGNYRLRYKEILKFDNVSFIDQFDVDNYALLSRFNYVLGYYSTMMFEARFFNVKAIVLPSDGVHIGGDFFYMDDGVLDFSLIDSHYSLLDSDLDKYFSYPSFNIGDSFEKNN